MVERVIGKEEVGYKALELACAIMNDKAVELGYLPEYTVGDTYFDFGQGWTWTTIIYDEGRDGFQALYPNEWRKILELDFSGVADSVERQVNILHKEA